MKRLLISHCGLPVVRTHDSFLSRRSQRWPVRLLEIGYHIFAFLTGLDARSRRVIMLPGKLIGEPWVRFLLLAGPVLAHWASFLYYEALCCRSIQA